MLAKANNHEQVYQQSTWMDVTMVPGEHSVPGDLLSRFPQMK
uniref:Uncharacterized protein n=1 Tax=Anguilla anguilla TaxID=7936 RepID=A0A0E9WD97_ANGAN